MSAFKKFMDDADMHMTYAEKVILSIESKDEEQERHLANAFFEIRKAHDSFLKACESAVEHELDQMEKEHG